MYSKLSILLLAIMALLSACQLEPADSADNQAVADPFMPPAERWGQLFVDVQMAKVFPDGKTFVDCTPKAADDEILAAYEANKDKPEFHLKAFVLEYFERPKQYASGFQSDTSRSPVEHINALWPILTREPGGRSTKGTLIPLPNPYVVPGGRFGEIYYWDSYFTMLGLQRAGKVDMIENMIDNFAYLIDTIGFIPNGNRDYFLTRSQPPFFAAMVNLLAAEKGDSVYAQYLPRLEKEYAFWMDGAEAVSEENPAVKHVVRLPNGALLNRYWDAGDYPRAEMYRDDIETAEQSARPAAQVYRDIRSACESGWDFSSRWLADPQRLETIHTTDIIPVDLNALLYNLERTLAKAHRLAGDDATADNYTNKAAQRQAALLNLCWDAETAWFRDYDYKKQAFTPVFSVAGAYPLFFPMATPSQGDAAATTMRERLLRPGGLVSTPLQTGQQWDAPNGWAPLQWIGIQGLRNYGQDELADEIERRWVDLNVKVYENTGKMVEKYNVEDLSLEAGGGEYPVQDGFGWTNGVLLRLMTEQPQQ
ncbi:MAG: alpha,alpha-trehalase TreF [Bacteroidetes bacterium]|jgi:alpha,alpha-trehalase|nr:alpha,alpha-trehalase TreF [Bacteroidota bacterium]